MTLYSSPPSLREWQYNKPTLLVCWWASTFCATLIVLRVAGRFIRTERLFREDKMAALALIPMILRMGCVHYILSAGTNNADFSAVTLSAPDIRRKEVASGLVLLSRILYAATLWILKDSILEFFRRLTGVTWSKAYEKLLFAIRCTLAATFVAVVISTLAECRPFTHYWQVLPDPGGQCRQGYANLITLAVCNIITDLLLVFFPVPIIMRTQMPIKRKVQLVLLFSLSLAVVAVTIYRVPHAIAQHGRQQYRSLLASIELLFATGAANSLVLGSFVRDRGLKKNKYELEFGSFGTDAADSLPRRPTLNRHWGSDDDLVRDLGLGVHPELRHEQETTDLDQIPLHRAPPVADLEAWHLPSHHRHHGASPHRTDETLLDDAVVARRASDSPPKAAFNDVGSLLSSASPGPGSIAVTPGAVRSDSALTALAGDPGIGECAAGVWRPSSVPPPPVVPASASGFLRGSSSLLLDLGGLLARPPGSSMPSSPMRLSPLGSPLSRTSRSRPLSDVISPISQSRPSSIPQPEIKDPGGLLSRR